MCCPAPWHDRLHGEINARWRRSSPGSPRPRARTARSGSTASWPRRISPIRRTRSTASATCRASSRPRSPSRATTASTSTRTTSGWWRMPAGDGSLADSTCWSAAASGAPPTSRTRGRRSREPLGYVQPQHVVEAARAVVAVQRDYGDRTRSTPRAPEVPDRRSRDRLVPRRGRVAALLRARAVAARCTGRRWTITSAGTSRAMGCHCYGLFVENGRIHDTDDERVAHRAARGRRDRCGVRAAPHAAAERPVHQPRRPRAARCSWRSSIAGAWRDRSRCRTRSGIRWRAPRIRPAGSRSPSRSGRCRR